MLFDIVISSSYLYLSLLFLYEALTNKLILINKSKDISLLLCYIFFVSALDHIIIETNYENLKTYVDLLLSSVGLYFSIKSTIALFRYRKKAREY